MHISVYKNIDHLLINISKYLLLREIGNNNVLRFAGYHVSKPEIYGCYYEEHEEYGTNDDGFGS